MGMLLEFVRNDFFESQFDFERRFAPRERNSVGDSEEMRVDGDRRRTEGIIHNDIGGLAADTGQGFK